MESGSPSWWHKIASFVNSQVWFVKEKSLDGAGVLCDILHSSGTSQLSCNSTKTEKWEISSSSVQFSSVHVQLFVTPWTEARQASMSITNSRSLLKLMSIKSVMPSNHLILCHPLLLLPSMFPSIRVFFQWVSSLHHMAKVLEFQPQHQLLPMNIQDWFPIGLTGLISLQFNGLSKQFLTPC